MCSVLAHFFFFFIYATCKAHKRRVTRFGRCQSGHTVHIDSQPTSLSVREELTYRTTQILTRLSAPNRLDTIDLTEGRRQRRCWLCWMHRAPRVAQKRHVRDEDGVELVGINIIGTNIRKKPCNTFTMFITIKRNTSNRRWLFKELVVDVVARGTANTIWNASAASAAHHSHHPLEHVTT